MRVRGVVAVVALAFASSAYAQPPRHVPQETVIYEGVDVDAGQVDCTAASGTLLTGSYIRRSVTFRNTGSADVYICSTDTLTEGGAPGTCTTAAAGIFLGGTAKDAITLDVSVFGVGWSCITSSGTGTVKYYSEKQ